MATYDFSAITSIVYDDPANAGTREFYGASHTETVDGDTVIVPENFGEVGNNSSADNVNLITKRVLDGVLYFAVKYKAREFVVFSPSQSSGYFYEKALSSDPDLEPTEYVPFWVGGTYDFVGAITEVVSPNGYPIAGSATVQRGAATIVIPNSVDGRSTSNNGLDAHVHEGEYFFTQDYATRRLWMSPQRRSFFAVPDNTTYRSFSTSWLDDWTGKVDLFMGTGTFDIAMDQAADADLATSLQATLADLEKIAYHVNVEMAKSELVTSLDGVGVKVSMSGDDFLNSNDDSRFDDIKSKQVDNVPAKREFDMNRLADIGCRACTLTTGSSSSGYSWNASLGLDDMTLEGVTDSILSVDPTVVPLERPSDSTVMKVASALPKALGAQMPFANGREEITRALVDEDDFENLAKFAVKGVGAADKNGTTKTLQLLLESKRNSSSAEYDTTLLTSYAASSDIADRYLHHELILHLFRSAPPRPQVDGSASAFWEYVPEDGSGNDEGYYKLARLEKGVVLNFVLKTSLDLKEQTVSGQQNPLTLSTIANPTEKTRFDAGYDPNVPANEETNRVLVLYKFKFVL